MTDTTKLADDYPAELFLMRPVIAPGKGVRGLYHVVDEDPSGKLPRYVLAALRAAPAAEIPREPTQAMIDAAFVVYDGMRPGSFSAEMTRMWRAMHDAAINGPAACDQNDPSPSQEGVGGAGSGAAPIEKLSAWDSRDTARTLLAEVAAERNMWRTACRNAEHAITTVKDELAEVRAQLADVRVTDELLARTDDNVTIGCPGHTTKPMEWCVFCKLATAKAQRDYARRESVSFAERVLDTRLQRNEAQQALVEASAELARVKGERDRLQARIDATYFCPHCGDKRCCDAACLRGGSAAALAASPPAKDAK